MAGEATAEEKLEGDLHDVLSDLLGEKLSKQAHEVYYEAFADERYEAIASFHRKVIDGLNEVAEKLEDGLDDLIDSVRGCPRCGGSGGGPEHFKCRTCGGSGGA